MVTTARVAPIGGERRRVVWIGAAAHSHGLSQNGYGEKEEEGDGGKEEEGEEEEEEEAI